MTATDRGPEFELNLTTPDSTGYLREGGREIPLTIDCEGDRWTIAYTGEAIEGHGDHPATAAAALMREAGIGGWATVTVIDETAAWSTTTMIIDAEYRDSDPAPAARPVRF